MAKSLSGMMVFLVAISTLSNAMRTRRSDEQEQDTQQLTKCVAEGLKGKAEGMQITWGSAKAVKECGPTRSNKGEGYTYEYKFTEAFSVSFEKTKCECKIEGVSIVSFKPINLRQAKVCQGTEKDDDPMTIKRQCWEAYMRGRGLIFSNHGELSVPEYKVPWLSGSFRVVRDGPCEGVACDSVTMPGVLDGMTREHKRVIGGAIKQIMDGKRDEVPRVIMELIEVLPTTALDDAEFQQIDVDGDGTLTLDELDDFYPTFERKVLDKFIKEIDDNGNGTVDPEEFSALKVKMRDYDPTVDLIDGDVDLLLSPSGQIREVQSEWKVREVVCMKNGKETPGQCEGDEKTAITEFNQGC